MSGTSPRKFAEKIAIMNRKQNEDVNTFDSIMREVRQITSNSETQTASPPSTSLYPPQWNQIGGSLPNVHKMPSYADWDNSWFPEAQQTHRSRSPEQHPALYHPYGRGQKTSDRVPPLDPHYIPYPNSQYQLLPPEQWNQINRVRSDPGIHEMHTMQGCGDPSFQHKFQAGPSGLSQVVPCGSPCSIPNNVISSQPAMVPPVQSMVGSTGMPSHPHCIQSVNVQSPLQSPLSYQLPNYGYPNGSPMQSPLGSPLSSCLVLEERMTHMMELSPPKAHDSCSESATLPNSQHQAMPPHQQPPQFYHQTVGQRHSTSGAIIKTPRLSPTVAQTSESQSAPTSPANNLDPSQHLQWSGMRTFSNSPESLDIPRLVLTNPEGANRLHLECYSDLQNLTLASNDMQIPCNGVTNGNSLNQDAYTRNGCAAEGWFDAV